MCEDRSTRNRASSSNPSELGFARQRGRFRLLPDFADGPDLLRKRSPRHSDQLTAAERLVLAQDVVALVQNGRLPAGQAMGLLESLEKDSEPMVVQEAVDLADMLAPIVPPSLKLRFDQLPTIDTDASRDLCVHVRDPRVVSAPPNKRA